MATVRVTPGICGFATEIIGTADELYNVNLQITSECQQARCLAEKLSQVAAFAELRKPIHETLVYRAAGECHMHAACPVPCAILKAVEVALGMALPADVHITVSRE